MGFRIRKSVKLGPGLRLTASHRGASIRVGGRGGGVSMSTSGRRTVSAGVPGSGVGYQKSWQPGQRQGSRPTPVPVAPSPPPKPGLFAPGYEKAFHKAIYRYAGGDAQGALLLFREAAEKDESNKALGDDFFAGLLSAQLREDASAIQFLEKVVTAATALPDQLMSKYVEGGSVAVPITESVAVEVPFGSLAAALTLAELYQRNGRGEEAIGLLQQLVVETGDHPFLILSLCDLYAEVGAWDEIVDVAAGVTNEDDVSLQVRLIQARAFREQGMDEAALEAYKDALRSKKRNSELLKQARYERAKLYLASGKKAQGRKELEKLYAEDAQFRDVAELLRPDDRAAPGNSA
jgi:tetratricopeptide (TPR) repeat protein